MELKEDLELITKTIEGKIQDSKIYPRTNEDIGYIMKNINFTDKEVLSVLASSDQMLEAYYLGAKNVDTFDKNKLCEYYYYLRKWCIKYRDEISPNIRSNRYLLNTLKKVEIENKKEEVALELWKYILKKYDKVLKNKSHLMHLYYKRIPIPFKDIEKLKQVVPEEITFYNIDISKDINKKNNIEKKYDIVYLSNILDYISSEKSLEKCRDNLSKLLKKEGLVVGSVVFPFEFEEDIKNINEIMQEKFELDYKKGYSVVYRKELPLYYTYKKRG